MGGVPRGRLRAIVHNLNNDADWVNCCGRYNSLLVIHFDESNSGRHIRQRRLHGRVGWTISHEFPRRVEGARKRQAPKVFSAVRKFQLGVRNVRWEKENFTMVDFGLILLLVSFVLALKILGRSA